MKSAASVPLFLLVGTALWMAFPESHKATVPRSAPARSVSISDTADVRDLIERGSQGIPLNTAKSPEIPAREWMASAWQVNSEPAMQAFSQWAMDFIQAPEPQKAELEEQGIGFAKVRGERMLELITQDPKQALASTVPEEVIGQLPATVTAHLETPLRGFGDLVTEYRCHEEASSELRVSLNGKNYQANLYGSRKHLNYYLNTPLHGIAMGDQMAVLDSPTRLVHGKEARLLVGDQEHAVPVGQSLEKIDAALTAIEMSGTNLANALASKGLSATYSDFIYAMGDSGLSATVGYPMRRSPAHTHGGKKILILRLQASNGSFPASETESVFKNWSFSADGWNERLKLTSYGKTWLEAVDITPVLTLPGDESYYVHPNSSNPSETIYESGRWADDGEDAARQLGYNPADYFCVVVCTRDFPDGGFGWAAGKRIWVNGKFDNFAALMHHEFGHTLGLPHASSWTATDRNPISPNRVNVEYGDENDPMGNGGKTFRNTYQAYFKNLSGWMPDSSVRTITGSGIYTVYQDDGDTDLNRTLALKLGRDEEIMYWLSIRGDLEKTNSLFNQTNFTNGVSIVAVSPWENPHTLDLDNPNDGNRRNTPLQLNRTWYDENADITFKVVERGGAIPNRYAKVQVTFGPLYRGGYRPLVSGGVYRFRNQHNNRYLSVSNDDNGTRAIMADLNTTNNSQTWVAWRNTNGSYSFNRQGTDKWLHVPSDSGNTGVRIQQYVRSDSGNAQNWNIFQTEEGSVFIHHNGTAEGRLMEMDVNNQRVHQMNATGTAWQQWVPELVAISPGTYRILPRVAQSQALTTSAAGMGNGVLSVRNAWEGYSNQQWTVSNLDNGRLRLTPAHAPTKALDVDAAASADGSRIQQWTWNGGIAQRWLTSTISGHWLRFTPDCAPSGSLQARNAATGNSVQLGTYNGADSQHWRFADADPVIIETPIELWSRSSMMTGTAALPDADPDGDGVINLMEFAMGTNPLSATSKDAHQPITTGDGVVLLTPVRSGAVFSTSGGRVTTVIDEVRYEVQGSYDMADWTTATVQILPTIPENQAPPLPEGWEYRAFKIPSGSPTGKAFLRLVVSDES